MSTTTCPAETNAAKDVRDVEHLMPEEPIRLTISLGDWYAIRRLYTSDAAADLNELLREIKAGNTEVTDPSHEEGILTLRDATTGRNYIVGRWDTEDSESFHGVEIDAISLPLCSGKELEIHPDDLDTMILKTADVDDEGNVVRPV